MSSLRRRCFKLPNALYSQRYGKDVLRYVQGEDLGISNYRILSINSNPEDEHQQLGGGDNVQCEWK